MFSDEDHFFMQQAILLAKEAALNQEVPVGAVLVQDNKIIGTGFNRPISSCDPSAHAEIIALRAGAIAVKNYRLVHSTLYVTLEPCFMCVGALVHARVQRVVFGAFDSRYGAVENALRLTELGQFNHRIIYEGGLLGEECSFLLTEFFRQKRC